MGLTFLSRTVGVGVAAVVVYAAAATAAKR